MKILHSISNFFAKPIFKNEKFILGLWVLLAFAMGLHKALLGPHSYNNYMIFKHVFWNTIEQVNLYLEYPDLYFDKNHYGPLFSMVIAPFALLPDKLGVVLWCVFIALCLYGAIRKLPVVWGAKVAIYYICAHEMMTAAANQQTNALIAALIIMTFVAVHNGKDVYAGLFIALGMFIKLYGIVGLAFFFFSHNKPKFILSIAGWSVVMFVLPMLISSPGFIIQTYQDWFNTLIGKNLNNATSLVQDISVMGMFRRIFNHREWSNWLFLIPGMILFALQYIKIHLYKDLVYRLAILASTLLFVVLFSSGAESSTYVIAMVGVAVWFTLQNRPYSGYVLFLLIFAIVLTSFSPSDLFPAYIRKTYVIPYALKALPCFLLWITLVYQILFTNQLGRDKALYKNT